MKKSIVMALLVGAALQAADGETLFKKCAACHGPLGEKQALGKSRVINTMPPSEIETAIRGYKDGSYGGPMKAIMKGQVAALDEAEIKTIAEYIGAK